MSSKVQSLPKMSQNQVVVVAVQGHESTQRQGRTLKWLHLLYEFHQKNPTATKSNNYQAQERQRQELPRTDGDMTSDAKWHPGRNLSRGCTLVLYLQIFLFFSYIKCLHWKD